MADWTREKVEERLAEASAVLARLTGPQRRGYFSTWPDIVLTAREIADQAPRPMKVLASPQAISRMEETITWNRFLDRFHANLVWARADGLPWKHVCHRFGVSSHQIAPARNRATASAQSWSRSRASDPVSMLPQRIGQKRRAPVSSRR